MTPSLILTLPNMLMFTARARCPREHVAGHVTRVQHIQTAYLPYHFQNCDLVCTEGKNRNPFWPWLHIFHRGPSFQFPRRVNSILSMAMSHSPFY